jgi:UPF0755 protein
VAESRERTNAEREAARLERERRRAQRQEDEALLGERGRNGGTQGEVDDDGRAEDHGAEDPGAEDPGAEDHRAEDHGAEDHGAEDRRAEEHRAEDHGAEDHRAEDHRAEDHGAEDYRAEDDGHGGGRVGWSGAAEVEDDAGFDHDPELPQGQEGLESDEDDLDDDDGPEELPSGTRRVAHRERLGAVRPAAKRRRDREPRRRRRTGPVQRRRRPDGDRKRHSWAGRLLSVLAIATAVAAIWFLFELFQPFQSSGHGRVTVTIPAHASAGTIGKLLERDGVISSSFFFELRAMLAGERGDLRSGTYHLTRGMSYGDVLKILTTAPPAARVTSLTIVEGKTRKQVDALLRSQGVHGSYLSATRHSKLLDPRRYGAPRSTGSLEGFLFPDTYQLREPISVPALVADQLKAFRQRFRNVSLASARHKHLSPYDVLIIASMVQAEAETVHDRPLVASVIYNRLARGMPLQIDATTRYATGNYTRPLTDSQLNSRSPYNTRIHTGLPPGPINSPGLASIEAAAHPANTTYLYFVVKPCGNGEHAFASTYSKFQAEVLRYQTARSSRGGRSPAHC